jgi:predicted metalloprotease with PDZ domain
VEVPLPITELVTSERGALADRYLAGNVGGAVLRRFRVTFDYAHERVYFAPGGDAGPDSFDRAGLWLVPAGKELLVEDVIPGGPAAAAGVIPGDRIEAVDGVALTRPDLDAARERLHAGAPGTTVRLRVRGREGRRDLAVKLLELAAPSYPETPTPAGQATPVPPSPQ